MGLPIVTYAAVACAKCGVEIPPQTNAVWDSPKGIGVHHVECPATGATPPGPDPRRVVAGLLRNLTKAEASVRNAKAKEREAQTALDKALDEIGMAMFPGSWARVEERTAAYLDLGDKASEATTAKSKTYWASRARTAKDRMADAQYNLRQSVLDALNKPGPAKEATP